MEKKRFQTFRDLDVWRDRMELAREVYRVSRAFPRDEIFGLTAQVRRAAVSVPSNLAEGHARTGARELLHGLSVAAGSLAEAQTQLELAADLGYLAPEERAGRTARAEKLARMLSAFIRSLRGKTT